MSLKNDVRRIDGKVNIHMRFCGGNPAAMVNARRLTSLEYEIVRVEKKDPNHPTVFQYFTRPCVKSIGGTRRSFRVGIK